MIPQDLSLTYRVPESEDDELAIETEYTTTQPSTALVVTLAHLDGVEPTEVNFQLYNEFDPTAFDQLLSPTHHESSDDSPTVTVRSRIEGYRVVARDDGTIRVHAADS